MGNQSSKSVPVPAAALKVIETRNQKLVGPLPGQGVRMEIDDFIQVSSHDMLLRVLLKYHSNLFR
jgi:hypothetical protein